MASGICALGARRSAANGEKPCCPCCLAPAFSPEQEGAVSPGRKAFRTSRPPSLAERSTCSQTGEASTLASGRRVGATDRASSTSAMATSSTASGTAGRCTVVASTTSPMGTSSRASSAGAASTAEARTSGRRPATSTKGTGRLACERAPAPTSSMWRTPRETSTTANGSRTPCTEMGNLLTPTVRSTRAPGGTASARRSTSTPCRTRDASPTSSGAACTRASGRRGSRTDRAR
eukprot:scaffold1239_cov175-Pinguiococcus_pyrenoidosus.AAC.17